MKYKDEILLAIQLLCFLTLTVLALNSSASCDTAFAKVGAGYKFRESTMLVLDGVEYDTTDYNSPYSARVEVGIDCENISFGVAHHSQWADGYPFNDNAEYAKTEIFIDYKFEWSL